MAILLDGTTGISASGNISVGGTLAVGGSFAPQSVSTTGNVTGGNVRTGGQVSATGNVTGNYILGNGALLTGIVTNPDSITNGTSNVKIATANGNVVVTVNANTAATLYDGGVNVPGAVSASGNITGAVFSGNASGLTAVPGANVTGTVANATTAATVTGAAQGNITSVGTLSSLSVSGNVTAGNVSATNLTGTLATAAQNNITSVGTLSSLSVSGNVAAGNISATNLTGTLATAAQTNITSVGTLSALSVSGNVAAGNVTTTGLVNAGSLTTSGNAIIGGDLVVNGNTTSINITDLNVEDPIIGLGRGANNAPLTTDDGKDRGEQLWYYDGAEKSAFMGWDDSASKLIAAANVAIANEIVTVNSYGTFVVGTLEGAAVSVTGNVTAAQFNGSGAGLTSIPGANVSGTVANATFATSAASATTAATVTGAAQGNITSVGTLTALSVTGNVAAGNISATNLTGTLATAAQTNITSVGTLSALSVSGNVAAGNVSATNLTGTLATAAQTNITSVGTLSALSVTGNVQGGNLRTAGLISATGAITGAAITGSSLTVSTGNVTLGNIVNGGSNGVGNIGSATTTFNTVFARATSAQYADLAEFYRADAAYAPGTVVVFGGEQEVTQSTESYDSAVAGVISTDPAYIMNAGLSSDHPVAVALMGRVPCRVVGDISKGDLVVTSDMAGTAQRMDPAQHRPGVVIGKALESHSGSEPGMIEIVVGRL